jgi:hypothetical protein
MLTAATLRSQLIDVPDSPLVSRGHASGTSMYLLTYYYSMNGGNADLCKAVENLAQIVCNEHKQRDLLFVQKLFHPRIWYQ